MSKQNTPKPTYKRHEPANANERHRQNMSLLNRIGLKITNLVGTMICAIIFTCLSLISLPAAIRSHNLITIVAWIAQTFLQLVLLPIIMVGQNIQSQHSAVVADEQFKTTQTTYKDMERLIAINEKQLAILEGKNAKVA
jgi:uncharacterized membrane protein